MSWLKRRRAEGPRGRRGDGPGPGIAHWWEESGPACTSRGGEPSSSSRALVLRPIRRQQDWDGREAGHLAEPHLGWLHAAVPSGAKGGVAGEEEEALPALFAAEQLQAEARAARCTHKQGVNFFDGHSRLEAQWMEFYEIKAGEDPKLHGGCVTLSKGYVCTRYGSDQSWIDDAVNLLAEHGLEKDTTSYRVPNVEMLGIMMEGQSNIKGTKKTNLLFPPKSFADSGPKILHHLIEQITTSYGHDDIILFVKGTQSNLLHTQLTDEIMGADQSGTEESTNSEKIDCYIYKQFQLPLLRTLKTWRKKLFYGINIIPHVRKQGEGECSYFATIAAMESHFKAAYAVRPPDQDRDFNVHLSTEHLKEMVEDHYASKEGASLKGSQRLEICLKMAKLHGVMSEEDYKAGKTSRAKAKTYKVRSYWSLSVKEKKMMKGYLDKSEVILSSFRVSKEYLRLLPHEIYRYRDTESEREDRVAHQAHCIVLTGHGVVEEEKDEPRELVRGVKCSNNGGTKTFQIENYYEYLNSYTHRWGVDGFGFVYACSLRQSYRFRVEC